MPTKMLTQATAKRSPIRQRQRWPSSGRYSPLPAASPRPRSAAKPRLRVLVVDDQKELSDTLKMLLESWGYETEVAYDGEAAIAMALTYDPDVILLDIGLPKVDGCEVARQLNGKQAIHSALIVAVTAYVNDARRREIMEAGADLYLAKPVDPEVIHHLLEWLAKELPGNAPSPPASADDE